MGFNLTTFRDGLLDRRPHRWPIIAPVIVFVAAVLNQFNTDWSKFERRSCSLLALGVPVGFCES